MDKEIIRMKRLAGILTEGVMAVPGIGEQSESEMQTQATAAVNQGDADFDISQGGLEEGEQTCNECGSVMYEGHACGSDSIEEAKTRSKKPERFDATELAAAWGGHQVPEPGKEPGTVSVQHKTPPFSDKEDDENDEVKEGAWDTVKDISRRAANIIAPDDETLLRDLQRRAGITPEDPHVYAKQLARDNPEDPAGNFVRGGQDLDIFKETEESINEEYMSAEQAESIMRDYARMGLLHIEHQDDVLRRLSDSQLDELRTALSILIREYDLVPSLSEKYLQAYRNIEYHLGDRKSLRGLNESQELSEKKMKAKHKTKEKKLKKKYDKSGMKKSMMKQYGKEKGKQVYFAKIRGEAMKESSEFDQVFNLDDLDITIAESLYALDEAYDLNNGYEDRHYAVGDDYFPDGADSPVVDEVGPSGARQGDNPEQKKMQVATESVHRELVYEYRKFLKESS